MASSSGMNSDSVLSEVTSAEEGRKHRRDCARGDRLAPAPQAVDDQEEQEHRDRAEQGAEHARRA